MVLDTGFYTSLAVLFALALGFALWHGQENKRLKKQLQNDQADEEWVQKLMHFAWTRTWQTLIIFIGLGVAVAILNHNTIELRNQLADAANNLRIEKEKNVAVMVTPAVEPMAEQEAPLSSAEIDNDIKTIFETPSQSNEQQNAADSLKRRYEELLVSYLFLRKCNIAKPEDYHIINSALAQEMASINAPGRLQYDILTAAKGSYREMYSRTPCDQAGIKDLGDKYRIYIDSIAAVTIDK